jgi:hypothetical protein
VTTIQVYRVEANVGKMLLNELQRAPGPNGIDAATNQTQT